MSTTASHGRQKAEKIREKPEKKPSGNPGGLTSDFWWNFVYFVLLTTALSFIVANNPLEKLSHGKGLVIVLLLGLLDLYATFHMVRAWYCARRTG